MKGLLTNIEKETVANKKFRRVMYTSANFQLVKMSLKPGESIGKESHPVDQFFRVEKGSGEITMGDKTHSFKDGDAAVIPAGMEHDVRNAGTEDLKLYSIYSPPKHLDGTVHDTKADADGDEEEFDGETTEQDTTKKDVLKKIINK